MLESEDYSLFTQTLVGSSRRRRQQRQRRGRVIAAVVTACSQSDSTDSFPKMPTISCMHGQLDGSAALASCAWLSWRLGQWETSYHP